MASDIGLRPWEFWELTPAELDRAVDSARKREDREWYRTAWLVSYLIAPHLKKGKKITPEKLLGLETKTPQSFIAPDAESRWTEERSLITLTDR